MRWNDEEIKSGKLDGATRTVQGGCVMSRDVYKELGICTTCGKEKAEPNKASCWECLERYRKYQAKKRENGNYNKETANRLHREMYAKRKELGLCTKCGRKKQSAQVLCTECRIKNNRRRRKDTLERSDRVGIRMCYFCGDNIIPGKRTCPKCYKRTLKSVQKMNDIARKKKEVKEC